VRTEFKALIIFPLSLILISTPAVAAVKAGASCNSKGQIRTLAGYKYTCVKSGGKLLWSKSEYPVKSKPVTKPTLSASAKPKSDLVQEENVKLLKKAFTEIRSYSNPNHEILKTTFQDPTASLRETKWILDAENNVLESMGGLLAPSTHLFSVFASTTDFALSSYVKIEAITGFLASDSARINGLPSACWISGCAFASVNQDFFEFPVMTYAKARTSIDTKELGAHEVFHVVQNALNKTPWNLPCWIHEGQASFVGSAFANPEEKFESTIRMIRAFGRMKTIGSNLSKMEAPQGWKGGHGNCMDIGEYQAGRIANVYLVGKYGWQKSIDYLKAMDGQPSDGESWKTKFEYIFGKPVGEFYAEAEVFIKWFFKSYVN
jgi:hypothetical protein